MSRSARRPRTAQSPHAQAAYGQSPRAQFSRGQSAHAPSSPARAERSRSARPARPRPPRPEAVSELELALTASLDAPAGPADFAALKLPQHLHTALQRAGITHPFPIQARTLPDALAGRDVLGRAETGSGKTLAFGLPMLARLTAGAGRRPAGAPGGLVLVPTRELAGQVHAALAPLGQPAGVRVLAVFGGAPIGRQVAALRRGVDLLVATPGRLLDLIRQGECSLAEVEVTAIDEADHMADLGFLPDVTRILDLTRAGGQRLLFSATLDRGVDRLARAYLTDPVPIAVAPAAAPVATMDHLAFTVRHEDKVAVTAEIAARPGADAGLRPDQARRGPAGPAAEPVRRGRRRAARQPRPERPAAGAGRLRRRPGPGAGGHRRRRPRDPRGRRGPGRALRPARRPQGLPAPLRADRPGRRPRHRAVAAAARAGPGQAARVQERAGIAVGSTPVAPGHQAVTALSRSGEPIVVREEPAAPPASRAGSGRRPRRGPGRRRRDQGATAA